ARWDGTDWSSLTGPSGTGMNIYVDALIEHNGDLIAGGAFTIAGGLASSRIAAYRPGEVVQPDMIFQDAFERQD
ncbi:MAG: hypothetical protein ACLFSC_12670, partial [Wenzhouxiangella sp.]